MMFKKTQLAILVCCVSASSYAYRINSDLIVDNKTGKALQVEISNVTDEKIDQTQQILPGSQTHFKTNNGQVDNGLTGKLDTAIITIKGLEDQKIYLQARLNYYVGAAKIWEKYSFIDAITKADGVKATPSYTCVSKNYSDPTFNNGIVIEETSGKGITATAKKDFPYVVTCMGLKSSELLGDNNGKPYQDYYPVCFNENFKENKSKFMQSNEDQTNPDKTVFAYANAEGKAYSVIVEAANLGTETLQTALDNEAGYKFCNSWKTHL